MQAKEGQRGPSRFGRDALISPQSSIGLYRESSGSYDEGFVSDTKPADKRPNRQARQGKPWRRGGRLERHKVPLVVVLIPQGQGVGWGWGLVFCIWRLAPGPSAVPIATPLLCAALCGLQLVRFSGCVPLRPCAQ